MLLNFIFIFIYFIASYVLSGTEQFILLTIHFIIISLLYINKNKYLITPIFIYYIGVIFVNIANINLINLVLTGQSVKTYSYIVPKFIDSAASLWTISSTMFLIGYEMFSNKQLPKIYVRIENLKIFNYIFIFLLIENVLFIMGSGFNIRGNQIGKLFSLLNTIGILFFARIWAKEQNNKFKLYALSLYVLETYHSLISSFLRFELILPTFYLFTGYFIGKGHIRYIFSYRIFPLLVVLFVYSSMFSTLKENRANFIAAFAKKDKPYYKPIVRKEDNASSGLLSRSSNIAQLTNIIKLVEKNNGPYGGIASQPILIALIPRFLWPGKPQIQLGTWFANEIGAGYKNEKGIVNNSVNMTVAGELFLDFGWLGLILGSMLFGGFIAVLWNSTSFYSSEYNLLGTIFGGYLIMLSIGSYADLQIVVTLTSTYLLFYLIRKLIDNHKLLKI